ncbi:MFS transporter [Pelagibacterium nitratireducens]|uniref:MFS transporter n=1 Tax=Pelagibacterium nitratireducens TaxID=1046114 RepID=A0ABZ2I0F5_9HYPH
MTSSVRSVPFLRLWCGNTASAVATWALPFILGFAVSTGAVDAIQLGILLALRATGFLIGVPIGGVLADRGGRRRILLVAGLIAAAGTLLTSLLVVGENTTEGFMLVIAGVILSGIGQGASRPAYQAIVPAIISRGSFQAANAALSLSARTTGLIGPALAVLIATTLGIGAAFVAIFVLWIVSGLLPPWPENDKGIDPGGLSSSSRIYRFAGDLVEGYKEARRHPWFFSGLTALSAVIAAGWSVTNVLTPQLSQAVFGDASLLAGTATAYACGAIGGAVILSNWKPTKRGWWALAGLGIYAVVPFSLLFSETYWIPVVAYFIAGIGAELFNIVWFTAIQQEMEESKLARVSSLDFIVSYGLAPLGLSVIAPLAVWVGTSTVLVAASIICLLAALLASAAQTSGSFSVERANFLGSTRPSARND